MQGPHVHEDMVNRRACMDAWGLGAERLPWVGLKALAGPG